jgi:hypothetical protein
VRQGGQCLAQRVVLGARLDVNVEVPACDRLGDARRASQVVDHRVEVASHLSQLVAPADVDVLVDVAQGDRRRRRADGPNRAFRLAGHEHRDEYRDEQRDREQNEDQAHAVAVTRMRGSRGGACGGDLVVLPRPSDGLQRIPLRVARAGPDHVRCSLARARVGQRLERGG